MIVAIIKVVIKIHTSFLIPFFSELLYEISQLIMTALTATFSDVLFAACIMYSTVTPFSQLYKCIQ